MQTFKTAETDHRTRKSSKFGKSLAEGLVILGTCTNSCAPAPVYPQPEPIASIPPLSAPEPEYLTVGIEYTESNPKRMEATVLDTSSPYPKERGQAYCWLFYSRAESGTYLVNPKNASGEPAFVGVERDVDIGNGSKMRAVVKIKQGHRGKWEAVAGKDGKPEVIYFLRGATLRPVIDSTFHADEACRISDVPRVSLYYTDRLDVVVIPLDKK
jgi:hypothetical protein